jgi:hypothetical protein
MVTSLICKASLAQSVERQTLNLKVAGSTPAWGFPFVLAVPIPSLSPLPSILTRADFLLLFVDPLL